MVKSLANDELSDLSVYQLSGLIRSEEITSKQLVELYLERIQRHGGKNHTNAYITVTAEEALKQAEKLDRLVKRKQFKGPLHGLPIAIKDNLDTKGIRTTAGSIILSDWYPQRDAHVVKKLKEAGAVIIGKTNMAEFAFGATTNNPHYGSARNPYDLTRIPGGSSGGSAAATAAGLCAASIGTDTGGSVRIPAALCGLVGLKPTLGRVGRGGSMYLSFTRDVIGPITRTVMDAAIMLQTIAGKDPRDPESSSSRVQKYYALLERESLKGKRFGLPRKFFFEVIHQDTQRAVGEAIREIQEMGGIVKEVEVKHIDLQPSMINTVFAECVYLIERYLSEFDPQATIDKYLDQLGPHAKSILSRQKGTPEAKPVPGYAYIKSVRDNRNKMIAGFEDAMVGLDALVFPTTPLPATKIGAEELELEVQGQKFSTFEALRRNCNPINVIGYPAITVPAGYSEAGLPIGLQMVVRPWEEDKLLSMAYAFEEATHIRKAPKL
jgi:aspartyl-tRNA(Asn)/glutamyl-tRNA(Gln) amidotransferase subunit A